MTIYSELMRLLKIYPGKKITVFVDLRKRDRSIMKKVNKLIEQNPRLKLIYMVLNPWVNTFDKEYFKDNGEELEVVLGYV